MNKRGSLVDMITIMVMVLVTAAVIVVIAMVWAPLNAALSGSVIGTDATASAILTQANATFGLFDGALIFAQVILIVILLISIFYIDSHPAMFFVSLFFLAMSVFVATMFSEVWAGFTNATAMNQTIQTTFPLTNYLFSNYGAIMMVVFFIFIILLYAKGRGESI